MTRALHTVLCMTYTDIIIIFRVFPIYYRPSSLCKSSASLSFFLSRSLLRAHAALSLTHTRVRKKIERRKTFLYTYTILQLPYRLPGKWAGCLPEWTDCWLSASRGDRRVRQWRSAPRRCSAALRASLSNANSTGTDATSVRTRSGGDAHEMTPMAALVFTATFALIIWIPSFAFTARVYPPNEGKDLPKQRKISPRVHFLLLLLFGLRLGTV